MNFYFLSVAVLLYVVYPSGSSEWLQKINVMYCDWNQRACANRSTLAFCEKRPQRLQNLNGRFCSASGGWCIRHDHRQSLQTPGTSSYIKVGCFKDRYRPRALPELLANYRGTLDWRNLKKVVEDCALEAYSRNYLYFSIQFYGECWSGKNAPSTYDRYGPSSNCYFDVGKEFTNVVYRLAGDEKECLDYSSLTSANRSSSYSLPAVGSSASCDSDLTPQWYRFLFPAGVQMASSHVPPQKCATVLSGWLESKQPKMTDGIVNGKVCFSLGLNKCYRSQTIQVRNCGRFYVYKLQPTRSCPMRYCGQY